MKLLRFLQLCSLFVFFSQPIFANDNPVPNTPVACCRYSEGFSSYPSFSQFGTAGFIVTDTSLWYPIITNSYPDVVSLSQNRNRGVAEGNVFLSPTGFTIGEEGNYWISMTAILQNPGVDSALIPVFLALDETFNPDDPSIIAGVAFLEPDGINTVHASGIIKNIAPGTRISLVATNGGSVSPQTVNVVSWSISLFKIL